MPKKQDITTATNRVCEMIPDGYLLAETSPAGFMNAIADRLESSKELLEESKRRFVDYEMSVDDDTPYHHRQFMQRLRQYLGTPVITGTLVKRKTYASK